MLKVLDLARKASAIVAACLMVLAASALPAYSQKMPPDKTPPAAGQKQDDPKDSGTMGEEPPHPFFTHEGLPDEIGSFSLWASAVVMRIDGATKGDFAFHLDRNRQEASANVYGALRSKPPCELFGFSLTVRATCPPSG